MNASPAGSPQQSLPQTLGELRHSAWSEKVIRNRGVQDELRENLIKRLRSASTEPLFPGILGYEDTVVPQIINAVLARHNFILLGLRGQAKSRILRSLTALLDPQMPYIAGCEIRDNPYAPLCRRCKDFIAQMEESTPIAWLTPSERYVEKLATPDVTVADLIGDVDPIRAARGGHDMSSELTMHYGLLPRANRGIFAINELPDLAGKIQVALFNILEEGDVQLKGYPVRLALDVAMVFSANPEDYTARGKIVTPLKDRIGSEVRTHYPATLAEGIAITQQETWSDRGSLAIETPDYLREIVEQLAFSAREDKKVDKRSGVSQRLPIATLELVLSSAERRALLRKEDLAVPRIADLYAAIPGITGKIELEYEGEMRGAGTVVNDLIRAAIIIAYDKYFAAENTQQIEQWFHLGGNIRLDDTMSSADALTALNEIQGLREKLNRVGIKSKDSPARVVAAAEFLLEGLAANKKIGRNEERAFTAPEKSQRAREPQRATQEEDWEPSSQRRPRRNFN
jgi:magnesium chelatase subunit I